jgi:acetoin utilization protein AcuB
MDIKRFDHIPTVELAMTPFPYAVDRRDSVARAQEMMRVHGVNHIPVKEGSALVGLVTDRDLKLLVHRALPKKDRERIQIEAVCLFDPYVVDVDTPLEQVVKEMAERRIGSALITHHDKLAGIFTVTDACRVLAEILQSQREELTPLDVA